MRRHPPRYLRRHRQDDRPNRSRIVALLTALAAAALLTGCDLVGGLLDSDDDDATSSQAQEGIAEVEEAEETEVDADDGAAEPSGEDADGASDAAEAAVDEPDGDGAAAQSGSNGGVEALPGTLPEVLVADSYSMLSDALRDVAWSDGDRFTVVCEEAVAPELRGRTVRGTDVYVLNNFVCLTGVHAGVFDMESGGTAAVELIERFDHPDVEVEDRNGVSASVWARIEAGYRFLAAEELEEG